MSSNKIKKDDKILVPWFNKAEWLFVYDLIYGDEENKKQALDIIKLWKIRVPKLPTGIDGTLIILESLLHSANIDDENLRLLHGTSIMRFLNICGAYTDKQESFYKTAKRNKLPDWLIDLRNDLAHDQRIPSKHMLYIGLEFCLDWLKTAYWDEQKKIMTDCVIVTDNNSALKKAVRTYCKINNLRYLFPYQTTIEKFKKRYDYVYKSSCDFWNIKDISNNTNIDFLLTKLLEIIKKINKEKTLSVHNTIFLDELVGENPQITFLKFAENNDTRIISKKVIENWQDVIQFLHQEDVLVDLVGRLFQKSCDIQCEKIVRLCSSLWLMEIFKSLQNIQGNLVLHPLKPNSMQKLKSMHNDILENPHEYTLLFLEHYLTLIKCPENFIKDSISAVEKFTVPQEKEEAEGQHTVEEFEQYFNNDSSSMDISEINLENFEKQSDTSRKWKLVRDTSIFEGCPLGVIASQTRDNNPLLSIS